MTAAGGHVNQSNHTMGCSFPCFWEHRVALLFFPCFSRPTVAASADAGESLHRACPASSSQVDSSTLLSLRIPRRLGGSH